MRPVATVATASVSAASVWRKDASACRAGALVFTEPRLVVGTLAVAATLSVMEQLLRRIAMAATPQCRDQPRRLFANRGQGLAAQLASGMADHLPRAPQRQPGHQRGAGTTGPRRAGSEHPAGHPTRGGSGKRV